MSPQTGSSDPPVVEVRGLRKEFRQRGSRGAASGSLVAVDNVSFALDRGASLAIVGESGSGKTTIARMLVRLEAPSAGSILVNGEVRPQSHIFGDARRRLARQIQMVFQDPYVSLNPRTRVRTSVGEVVSFHFGLSSGERARRVVELLDQVGLEERVADSYPRALSGGQRQRVAIARALAAEPQVLVLDEAVSSLDVSVQAQVINLLAEIREAVGISYVFISHSLAVVRQVSETVIVMHRGSVVERGVTADILEHPEMEYTQQLLASVPRRGWRPRRMGALGH